jgi:hypothetical protein
MRDLHQPILDLLTARSMGAQTETLVQLLKGARAVAILAYAGYGLQGISAKLDMPLAAVKAIVSVAIELKAGKGKTSESQIAMIDRLGRCGWATATARSLVDVQSVLIATGAPLRGQVTA